LKDTEVILFGTAENGEFLSAEELAKKSKTITWEMLTSVGERVPRVYVGSDADFINERFGE
jgi:alanine racemase